VKASEIIINLKTKTGSSREKIISDALKAGYVPEFLSKDNFFEIKVKNKSNELQYYVSKDYLCLGENENYLMIPAFPTTVTEYLNSIDCTLPTVKMVDQIYNQAEIKIPARPQRPNPGESITSTRLYIEIDAAIKRERVSRFGTIDKLVAGHKKDIVLSNALMRRDYKNNVAIYGWFYGDGTRIQGLNPKDHDINYVDYSHGFRLISNKCILNGQETTMQVVRTSPDTCLLVHDEPLRFLSY
jgi:hypothetical protein